MKVLQVGNLFSNTGGPALSMYLTIKGLQEQGADVDAFSPQPFSGEKVLADDINLIMASRSRIHLGGYDYIPGVTEDFKKLGEYDIIHAQGGWADIYDKAARYARKKGIPYIMTPRGGLYPQALKSSAWKKKLMLSLFIRKDMQEAACVQCTCIEEFEHYRNLGFTNPVAIIPNSFETRGVVEKEVPLKEKTVFGYLGRLHPRKRVERLIYAFAENREVFDDCELKIIGSDVDSYENFLKSEVERLNLTNVSFTSFLTGEEKDKAIRSLSCLILPSDYENFGNVIVEALARGVPCVTSMGAPWEVLTEYGCGYWIENDQKTISETMLNFANQSPENQRSMGLKGQKLVEEKFSVSVVGKMIYELYEWILGKASKPAFVYVGGGYKPLIISTIYEYRHRGYITDVVPLSLERMAA